MAVSIQLNTYPSLDYSKWSFNIEILKIYRNHIKRGIYGNKN